MSALSRNLARHNPLILSSQRRQTLRHEVDGGVTLRLAEVIDLYLGAIRGERQRDARPAYQCDDSYRPACEVSWHVETRLLLLLLLCGVDR